MKYRNIIILNQSKGMLRMVGLIVMPSKSQFQSELVKYDLIRKCPPRTCAG